MPALRPPPRVFSPQSSLPPPAATFRTHYLKKSGQHSAISNQLWAVGCQLSAIGRQRVASCRSYVANRGVPVEYGPGQGKSEIINLKSRILPHSPFRVPPWCRLKSPPGGLTQQHQRLLFKHFLGPPYKARLTTQRSSSGVSDPGTTIVPLVSAPLKAAARLILEEQAVGRSGAMEDEPPPTDTLAFRWSAVHNLLAAAGDLAADAWKARRSSDEETTGRQMRQFFCCIPGAAGELGPDVAGREPGRAKGLTSDIYFGKFSALNDLLLEHRHGMFTTCHPFS